MFSPIKTICIYDREKMLKEKVDRDVKKEDEIILRRIKDDEKKKYESL